MYRPLTNAVAPAFWWYPNNKMYTEPIILRFNGNSEIYAMRDEKGRIIGTGTREVCEVLVEIINRQARAPEFREVPREKIPRSNVRAAIVI